MTLQRQRPGQDIKGILGVRLDNRKVFRTAGPRTKLLEHFILSFIKLETNKIGS